MKLASSSSSLLSCHLHFQSPRLCRRLHSLTIRVPYFSPHPPNPQLGKYVNGFACSVNPNNTWSTCVAATAPALCLHSPCTPQPPYPLPSWAGLCATYCFYNASYVENDGRLHVEENVYQSDSLAARAVSVMKQAQSEKKPFYIHLTPVAPHWGTCGCHTPPVLPFAPSPPPPPPFHSDNNDTIPQWKCSPCPDSAHSSSFPNLRNPHTPAYNCSTAGLPSLMGLTQPLTPAIAAGEDNCFQHRVRSLQGLDRLVGTVLQQVEAMGLDDNTYIMFTGDNGFHLGEHRLAYGKGEPYESDTRVPMLVRGPAVAAGAKREHGTQHVDLVATVADLAGLGAADVPWPLDGLSMRPLWREGAPKIDDWRQVWRGGGRAR